MDWKNEAEYQQHLVREIYQLLPGKRLIDTIVIVTDPNYLQGIQDLMVLHHSKVALLEVKLSEKSKERPNQRWYVEHWGQYVFSAFIYPENEKEVLSALQQALAG